jgi:FKBP-type peptidyl-prolyl cis-trans isomerase
MKKGWIQTDDWKNEKHVPVIDAPDSVKKGDIVTIHIREYLRDGTLVGKTEREAPMVFEFGSRMLFPQLYRTLPAMKIGEKKRVLVPKEDANRHWRRCGRCPL